MNVCTGLPSDVLTTCSNQSINTEVTTTAGSTRMLRKAELHGDRRHTYRSCYNRKTVPDTQHQAPKARMSEPYFYQKRINSLSIRWQRTYLVQNPGRDKPIILLVSSATAHMKMKPISKPFEALTYQSGLFTYKNCMFTDLICGSRKTCFFASCKNKIRS